jgi:hypothetical protein
VAGGEFVHCNAGEVEGHTVETVEGGGLNIHSTLKCRCYHLDQQTVSGVHDVSSGQC